MTPNLNVCWNKITLFWISTYKNLSKFGGVTSVFLCVCASALPLLGPSWLWGSTRSQGVGLETLSISSFSRPPLCHWSRASAGLYPTFEPLSTLLKGKWGTWYVLRVKPFPVHLLCPELPVIFLLLAVYLYLVIADFNQKWTCENLDTQIRWVSQLDEGEGDMPPNRGHK